MKRKGFTLTEMLVVVVILGIVSGMSVPLIRNLSTVFEKKKYETYADTVTASAKLYTDSYSEDMFGRKEYGCTYITYENLTDKGILKDINIDNVSCDSDKTFVRVIKQKDKYSYRTYLGCGVKENNNTVVVTRYPEGTLEEINYNSCTGSNPNNINISIDTTEIGGEYNKQRKSTKIMLSSGTGIQKNVSISTAWSKDPNGFSNVSKWTKASFEIKGDQEAKLLNGDLISTTSNKLTTPKKTSGDYYLLVRVDSLMDLYGNNWVNNLQVGGALVATSDNYISYGPFKVDNQGPGITLDLYACGANGEKTGNKIATKTSFGNEDDLVTFTTQDVTGDNNKWLNATDFPEGLCFDVNIKDDIGIKYYDRGLNAANLAANANNYKTITNTRTVDDIEGTTTTIPLSILSSGHRYGKISSGDFAENENEIFIDLKFDKDAPTCGEATVTEANQQVLLSCEDQGGSGCTQNTYTKGYNIDNETEDIEISDKALNKKTCTVDLSRDSEPPTIKLDVYACNSSYAASGTPIKTFTTKENLDIHSADLVSNWMNKSSFPYGVCFVFNVSDDVELKSSTYDYNDAGKAANASDLKVLAHPSSKTYTGASGQFTDYYTGAGHRYFEFTAIDHKDKTTKVTADFKLDITPPTCSTSKSHTGYSSGVKVSISCSDNLSGVNSCNGTAASSDSESGVKSSKTYYTYDKAGNGGSCTVSISSSSCSCSTCYKKCTEKGITASECSKKKNYSFSQVGYSSYSGIGDCTYSCKPYNCSCSTCYS